MCIVDNPMFTVTYSVISETDVAALVPNDSASCSISMSDNERPPIVDAVYES